MKLLCTYTFKIALVLKKKIGRDIEMDYRFDLKYFAFHLFSGQLQS